jgi:hypothetical protein
MMMFFWCYVDSQVDAKTQENNNIKFNRVNYGNNRQLQLYL